jgi:hypothetical protein
MPALMQVDDAAKALVAGLKGSGFEITFPRRFTYRLKLACLLPYSLYFRLINRATGWRRRPLETDCEPGAGVRVQRAAVRGLKVS